MGTIGSTARITLSGFERRKDVTLKSDLPTQALLVYEAMLYRAKAEGWAPWTHKGIKGYRGHISQLAVTRELLATEDPITNASLLPEVTTAINRSLRKCSAAVCLNKGNYPGSTPATWFIAGAAPAGLKDAAQDTAVIVEERGHSGFSERHFLRPGERKLSEREVGEDLPVSEVTVRQGPKKTRKNDTTTPKETPVSRDKAAPLREHHAAVRKQHDEFKARVYEEVATCPVAISAIELTELMKQPGRKSQLSTIRSCLKELVDDGKLVKRLEDKSERHLRTPAGQSQPRARGPILYGTAPGPVPLRESLPPGISAPTVDFGRDFESIRKMHVEYQARIHALIAGYDREPYPSATDISDQLEMRTHNVHVALKALREAGKIEKIGNKQWHSIVPPEAVTAPEPEVTTEAEDAAPAVIKPIVLHTDQSTMDQIAQAHPQAIVEIMATLQRYGFAPQADVGKIRELETKLEEATAALDKERRVNKSLRAAIAAIES